MNEINIFFNMSKSNNLCLKEDTDTQKNLFIYLNCKVKKTKEP